MQPHLQHPGHHNEGFHPFLLRTHNKLQVTCTTDTARCSGGSRRHRLPAFLSRQNEARHPLGGCLLDWSQDPLLPWFSTLLNVAVILYKTRSIENSDTPGPTKFELCWIQIVQFQTDSESWPIQWHWDEVTSDSKLSNSELLITSLLLWNFKYGETVRIWVFNWICGFYCTLQKTPTSNFGFTRKQTSWMSVQPHWYDNSWKSREKVLSNKIYCVKFTADLEI